MALRWRFVVTCVPFLSCPSSCLVMNISNPRTLSPRTARLKSPTENNAPSSFCLINCNPCEVGGEADQHSDLRFGGLDPPV